MCLKIIWNVRKRMSWEWNILIRDWKFENWPHSRSVKTLRLILEMKVKLGANETKIYITKSIINKLKYRKGNFQC